MFRSLLIISANGVIFICIIYFTLNAVFSVGLPTKLVELVSFRRFSLLI